MQMEASVDKVVAASLTNDVIAQAKRSFISTFNLFAGPKAATQKTEIALDVPGMSGTLEVASPAFECEIRLGARMRAEALGRVDGVPWLGHELAMVEDRRASNVTSLRKC